MCPVHFDVVRHFDYIICFLKKTTFFIIFFRFSNAVSDLPPTDAPSGSATLCCALHLCWACHLPQNQQLWLGGGGGVTFICFGQLSA